MVLFIRYIFILRNEINLCAFLIDSTYVRLLKSYRLPMLGVVLHRNISSKGKYLTNIWPNLNRPNCKNE